MHGQYRPDAGAAGARGGLTAFLGVVNRVTMVALVALVAALVIRPVRRYPFGISEHIFLVAVNVFYIGAAAGLLLAR